MRAVLAVLALAWVLSFPKPVLAHEGHDHGAPPPPVSTTIAPRADASSADFELVAIARGTELRIYLDTFRDNEPVSGAEIEIDTPKGVLKPAAAGDAVYAVAAPWLAEPGAYDLAITVQVNGLVDILTATLVVPPPEAPPQPVTTLAGTLSDLAGAIVASAWADDIRRRVVSRDTSLWLIGAGGFLAGLVVAALFRGRRPGAAGAAAFLVLAAAMSDPAAAASPEPAAPAAVLRDVAQRFPDGAVFVPKPTQRILALRTQFTETKTYAGTVELPARVIPDPGGSGYVQASVSGRLAPPPSGFARLGTRVAAGDVLAYVQPSVGAADVTSQDQQSRELDQLIALAERKLERARRIEAVVAKAQIEDAELELKGLRARRANLERMKREPEPLVAPVSGVIAAVQATAGQIAEPNAVIFQIVDPARFWIEALSYEAHPIRGGATARLPDGRTLPLAYRGSGLAGRNQAIPIQFGVEGDVEGLRAGQFLTVLAETSEEWRGIAVPRASVLRGSNGQPIVYEHTNAERFVPREVRVDPLDGTRVLIVSGVEAGRRIVTQGAELLNQIR